MWIDCVGPIREETAGAREIAEWIDCGQTVAGSKRNNQLAMRAHRRTNGQNDQTDIRRRRERIQGALDFAGLTHVDRAQFDPERGGGRLHGTEQPDPRRDGWIA